MSSKITYLTAKQKDMLPAWRDKWIAIGLSTEPADREKAEAAYRACYRYAGLRDDVPIVWVQSPVVGAFAAVIAEGLLKSGAVDDAVYGAVYGVVRGAVDGGVGDAVHGVVDGVVGGAVGDAVDDAVDDAVYGVVHGAVGDAVDDAVGGAVYGVVRGAVDGGVKNSNLQWHAWLGGSLWAAWPAYESYFREVCGLRLNGDLTERAAAYAATSEHGCY
ncbi:MAG: hypothetical protein KGL39_58785, partial [Patescibacteria group bacterium]|nr:hypothetical protein [Patescibacteria group bacterium]